MYFLPFVLRNTAFGHFLSASVRGIPDLTPNFRASYEQVATTPLCPFSPPTITGFPRKFGLSRCSIAAKNASMSTCMMRRSQEVLLCVFASATPFPFSARQCFNSFGKCRVIFVSFLTFQTVFVFIWIIFPWYNRHFCLLLFTCSLN